jgi:hypothetical protein
MKKIGLLVVLVLITSVSNAERETGTQMPGEVISLSAETRDLLRREMNEIKLGMESLVSAIAAGDWQTIKATGRRIKHTYIFKKQLTQQQKQELHNILPPGFKELDKRFHYYAGMLAHVAEERDRELVNYYFYKMNESCGSCHSKYAAERFPGFQLTNKHEHMSGKHQH